MAAQVAPLAGVLLDGSVPPHNEQTQQTLNAPVGADTNAQVTVLDQSGANVDLTAAAMLTLLIGESSCLIPTGSLSPSALAALINALAIPNLTAAVVGSTVTLTMSSGSSTIAGPAWLLALLGLTAGTFTTTATNNGPWTVPAVALKLTVKDVDQNPNPYLVVTGSLDSSGTNVADFILSAAATTTLGVGIYVYDVRVTWPDGTTNVLVTSSTLAIGA